MFGFGEKYSKEAYEEAGKSADNATETARYRGSLAGRGLSSRQKQEIYDADTALEIKKRKSLVQLYPKG